MGHCDRGFDFDGSLDDIIRMARDFGEKMKGMAPEMDPIFSPATAIATTPTSIHPPMSTRLETVAWSSSSP